MYYIRINSENENQLIYYCRNCGHVDNIITSENVCVSKTHLTQTEQKYSHVINEYTKLDPTLPRINTIRCPNQSCASNENNDSKREIIYIRYDDVNMKYIYLCSYCDTAWKTDEQK